MNLHYIDEDNKFKKVIQAVQNNAQFGFDLEASSLDPITGTLLLVQLFTGTDVFVINVGKVQTRYMKYLFELINASQKLLIGHNVKFDMKYIHTNYDVMPLYVYDTMEAETLHRAGLTGPFHKLSTLLNKYLGVAVDKDIRDQFIDKTDFEFTDEQIEYAATDVCYLFELKEVLDAKIVEKKQVSTLELESRVLPVVADMENTGIYVDLPALEEGTKHAKTVVEQRKRYFLNYVAQNFSKVSPNPSNAVEAYQDFAIPLPTTIKGMTALEEMVVYDEIVSHVLDTVNFNSSWQMKRLAKCFGIKEDSTAKEILEKYPNNEFAIRLLSYREYLKDVSTYGESLINAINPVTNRIHADFNPLGTATGRFSSSGPNLQNIKRGNVYRERFIAEPGFLMATADYSQIELRVGAVLSKETAMIEAFNAGQDLHLLTAAAIFNKDPKDITDEERSTGKTLNFSVMYGTSASGLEWNFGIPFDEGKVYLERFFSRYPRLDYFIQETGKIILERGYSSTANGRRRFFSVPRTYSKKDIRKTFAIKREGVNHIVQGTSGDMIKMALCYMYYDNPFGRDFRRVNTVHDEVVVEFRESIREEAVEFINNSMVKAGDYFLKGVVETKVGISVKTHWSK